MAKVVNRREAVVRNLVDVEGELCLTCADASSLKVTTGPYFAASLGNSTARRVGGLRVADVVADVVGERPDGKGKLVGVLGVAKKVNDEVAGADVMGQVGEEGVAERIVADILNDAARIGVGPRLLQLFSVILG